MTLTANKPGLRPPSDTDSHVYYTTDRPLCEPTRNKVTAYFYYRNTSILRVAAKLPASIL